jgi:hypothetical protein
MPAFQDASVRQINPTRDLRAVVDPLALEQLRASWIRELQTLSDDAVQRAIERLDHDEHIDAAIRGGVIDVAFIVSDMDDGHIRSIEERAAEQANQDARWVEAEGHRVMLPYIRRNQAKRPFSYEMPSHRMIVLEKRHDYPWLVGDADDRDRAWADNVLETRFIQERLEIVSAVCRASGVPPPLERPFILDIDLDYFRTRRSIAPNDATLFYEIVRRSIGITVARESICVENGRLDDGGFTASWLEQRLLEHIQRAVASS